MKLGLAARVVPRLEDLLPARFDLVLDTVGGPGTLAQALEGLASGGRAVVVGLSGLESPLSLQDLVLGEKALLGSYLFTPQEFQEALDLLPHLPEALVQRWPAAQAPEAFQALLEGRVPEPKLVLVW
jgi:D-arabinose 1-dehydrogenase-like Zn-dependent alcohol dehydrogenase